MKEPIRMLSRKSWRTGDVSSLDALLPQFCDKVYEVKKTPSLLQGQG